MASSCFPTAIGNCRIDWEGEQLTRFYLPEAQVDGEADDEAPAWVQNLIGRVQQHLAGRFEDFSDAPIAWERVSEFQRGVYRETLAIKAGRKRSYGSISEALGLGAEGARAVGTALGANPWPLLVPCHRVVSATDRMTGFSGPGGVRTKTRLLALEGAELLSE